MNRITLLLSLVGLVVATVVASGCTLWRAVRYNTPTLDDQDVFASAIVRRGDSVAALPRANDAAKALVGFPLKQSPGHGNALEAHLDATATAAFIVVLDGRIVYERYARGYTGTSLFNGFSVAKSIVSTLVGIALMDGDIHSLEQTVAEFRPDLARTIYGDVTLRNLLAMRSGAGELLSLIGTQAEHYYGDDLERLLDRVPQQSRQGEQYGYRDSDVQTLAFVLEAATGKSLADYLSEKLWRPLGMEAPAQWALDHPGGNEKAFCCLSARARDFARFGLLLANGGVASGRRIVPRDWTDRSSDKASRAYARWDHGRLWWHPADDGGDFVAYGYKGQNVYVNPSAGVVIVKFSERHQPDPLKLFRGIAQAVQPPPANDVPSRIAAAGRHLR